MDFNSIFQMFNPQSGSLDPFALGNMLATNPEGAIPMLSQLGPPPTGGQPLHDWINSQVAGGNVAGTTAGMPEMSGLLSPLGGLHGGVAGTGTGGGADTFGGANAGLPPAPAPVPPAPSAPAPVETTLGGNIKPPPPPEPVASSELTGAATPKTAPLMPELAPEAAPPPTKPHTFDMFTQSAPGAGTLGGGPEASAAPSGVLRTDDLMGHPQTPLPETPASTPTNIAPPPVNITHDMMTGAELPSLPTGMPGTEAAPDVGNSGGIMGAINSMIDALKHSAEAPAGQASILDAFKPVFDAVSGGHLPGSGQGAGGRPIGETNAGSLSDWFGGFNAARPPGGLHDNGVGSPLDINSPVAGEGGGGQPGQPGQPGRETTTRTPAQALAERLGGAGKGLKDALAGVKAPGAPENRILPPGNASPPHPTAMPHNALAQLIQSLVGRAGSNPAALRLGQVLK